MSQQIAQSADNTTTQAIPQEQVIHEYQMENSPEYKKQFQSQQYLDKLLQEQALQDQSMTMMMGAQGLGTLSKYGTPFTHAASRVINAVQRKDPKALVGLPSLQRFKAGVKSGGDDREKLLWQATGNGTKYSQVTQPTPPQ